MTNEQRLIDADALIKSMREEDLLYPGVPWSTTGVQKQIDKLPTVDAVEVVRCKDCKHCLSDAHGLWCFRDYEYNLQPDDFCSHGERRGKDAVD